MRSRSSPDLDLGDLNLSGRRAGWAFLARYLSPITWRTASTPQTGRWRWDGPGHLYFVGDADTVPDETEEFVTGVRGRREPDRVLATVLFVDVVRSTELAAELGDVDGPKP